MGTTTPLLAQERPPTRRPRTMEPGAPIPANGAEDGKGEWQAVQAKKKKGEPFLFLFLAFFEFICQQRRQKKSAQSKVK